ncbi:MAG: redox-regulated ATPase YchF [Planctomycetes bacterium]|nr:redox-regulated ATPase YchF [Planctomycetota bacterium]
MAERGPAAKVAIIGIQGAGKTTLFCALTGMDPARAAAHSGKTAAAAVRVLDPRLLAAHQKNGPDKKLVAPTLEFIDTPPLWLEGPQKQDNPGIFAQFRDADGFILVIKAYEEADRGKIAGQIEAVKGELFLADVDVMQKRIEKLRADTKKPLPNRVELLRELAGLERLAEAVAGGDSKAFDTLKEEDEKKVRGFQFFSKKPIIPLANVSEMDLSAPPFEPTAALKLELELLGMEESERASFMKDYGLASLATAGFPRQVFDRLGLQTFLTLGDKDTTAWAVRKGATSLEAAGKIHTDIQKGFINAEIISWADLEKAPSPHAARQKQRVEGKAYVMRDFDVVNVKFNV